MKQEYDYIIVGQGIAGSCLALKLIEKGKKVFVFNDPKGNSSSRVAAGLINPVTGRKMVLTWRANDLFPFLHDFYRNAESILDAQFYHEIPIYRPFISVEEQNEWQGKSIEPNFKPYIKNVITSSEKERVVNDPYGGLLLKKGGYLDTIVFLEAVNSWLSKRGMVTNEKFKLDSLNFISGAAVYNGIKANMVVFCNGVEITKTCYFSEIKFRPVKGEVLTLSIEPSLNKVYNRGVFIMPRKKMLTVGSNYNHKDLTWNATKEGRAEIEEKLKGIFIKKYEVVGHRAGVRPSVADRRPVLGSSSANEQIVIFNGLGTKGVSLAPFFANQLANNLVNGAEIDKEVNVNRFYK